MSTIWSYSGKIITIGGFIGIIIYFARTQKHYLASWLPGNINLKREVAKLKDDKSLFQSRGEELTMKDIESFYKSMCMSETPSFNPLTLPPKASPSSPIPKSLPTEGDRQKKTFTDLLKHISYLNKKEITNLIHKLQEIVNLEGIKQRTTIKELSKEDKLECLVNLKDELLIYLISIIMSSRFMDLTLAVQYVILGKELYHIGESSPTHHRSSYLPSGHKLEQNSGGLNQILLSVHEELLVILIREVKEALHPSLQELSLTGTKFTVEDLKYKLKYLLSKASERIFRLNGENEYRMWIIDIFTQKITEYNECKENIYIYIDYICTPYFQSLLMEGIELDLANMLEGTIIPYFLKEFPGEVEGDGNCVEDRDVDIIGVCVPLHKIIGLLFRLYLRISDNYVGRISGELEEGGELGGIDGCLSQIMRMVEHIGGGDSQGLGGGLFGTDDLRFPTANSYPNALRSFLSWVYFM